MSGPDFARRRRGPRRGRNGLFAAATLACAIAAMLLLPAGAGAVSGAAFTTDNPGVTDPCLNGPAHSTPSVNCNIYQHKVDVWINGGPSGGQNQLSSGTYFFAVLDPGGQKDPNDGTVGNLSDPTADGSAADREFTVGSNGKIATFIGSGHNTSSGGSLGLLIQLAPYDDTDNPGGVYILAVCQISSTQATTKIDPAPSVDPSSCKYDAFKVTESECVVDCGETQDLTVAGSKYYDANTNGERDGAEVGIANWPITYTNATSGFVLTDGTGAFSITLPGNDVYTFTEVQGGGTWIQTGNTVDHTSGTGDSTAILNGDKTYTVALGTSGGVSGLDFGNVCIGAGGGLTIGFWSNKNGSKLVTASDLTFLGGLYLVQPKASSPFWQAFDPSSAGQLATWLLNATATNMAYMLSAQLAGMELNVRHNFVNGNALIYAPGTTSANANGFATVNAVMTEANAALLANPYTVAISAARSYEEALKTALDKANNNLNFAEPGPGACPAPPAPPNA